MIHAVQSICDPDAVRVFRFDEMSNERIAAVIAKLASATKERLATALEAHVLLDEARAKLIENENTIRTLRGSIGKKK